MDKPRLIETGTHMYLKDILKSCHTYRSTVYYYSLNTIVLVGRNDFFIAGLTKINSTS